MGAMDGFLSFVVLLLAAHLERVSAQATTNATCLPQYSWMSNTRAQSPCLVTAWLATPCSTSGNWEVPALNSTQEYSVPSTGNATPCNCNTVRYSLLMACALCQFGDRTTIKSWTEWIANCPVAVQAKTYPLPVPPDTVVPNWAYLDPTITGRWDPDLAQSYAVSPSASINPFSATLAPASTVSPTISTPVTQPAFSLPATTPTPSPQTSEGKTKSGPLIGAIVGGIIAGIVVLGLMVAALWYFLIYKKRQAPPPPQPGPPVVTEQFKPYPMEYPTAPMPYEAPHSAAPAYGWPGPPMSPSSGGATLVQYPNYPEPQTR